MTTEPVVERDPAAGLGGSVRDELCWGACSPAERCPPRRPEKVLALLRHDRLRMIGCANEIGASGPGIVEGIPDAWIAP
jgi:hypothetical protein